MTDPEIRELGMARVAVSGLIDENKMLRTDNERLTTALQMIIDDTYDEWAKTIARRALEPKP